MNQKGQTSIEYLLLIVVSVGLGMTFLSRMGDYFVKNPNSFVAKSLNNYKAVLGSPEGRYKRFKVHR